MKSFTKYPVEADIILNPHLNYISESAKIITEYELYNKVKHLSGNTLRCGAKIPEGGSNENLLDANLDFNQKLSAFEKKAIEAKLNTRLNQYIDYEPGQFINSAIEYLVENPELKLSYLSIGLDDYHSTISALELFFPRIVENGILVLNNYYKKQEDYNAARDYFFQSFNQIQSINDNSGPHYLVKN